MSRYASATYMQVKSSKNGAHEDLIPRDFDLDEYNYLRHLGLLHHQISRSWMWDETKLLKKVREAENDEQ